MAVWCIVWSAVMEIGMEDVRVSKEVSLRMPAVINVRLNTRLPFNKGPLPGRIALGSLEVMAIVSLVLMTFQNASTAFTVALKAVPADCASGLPVLPEIDPGTAVSPGRISCN